MNTDTLIYFGDAVKAFGDGKVGGYLVRFSTAADPDLTGDFFTKDTDFDLARSTKATVLYDHGLDATLKRRKLGMVECKVDEVGVWAEGQLELRDEYEQRIYAMAQAGKLGWSSGTAPHLVERKQVGDAFQVLTWPLGLDASLTPRPAEPRTLAVSLKSYVAEKAMQAEGDFKIGDRVLVKGAPHMSGQAAGEVRIVLPGKTVYGIKFDDMAGVHKWYIGEELKTGEAVEKSLPAIKGLFEAELANRTLQTWDLRSTLDRVFERIALAVRNADVTGVRPDVAALVSEAVASFDARFVPAVVQQINDFAESKDERFWLKSGALVSGAPLLDHSAAVVSAVQEHANQADALKAAFAGLIQRVKDRIEFRKNDATKSGAMLSKANRDKLAILCAEMRKGSAAQVAMADELDTLLAAAAPKSADKDDDEMTKSLADAGALYTEFLQLQTRLIAAGV